MGKKKSKDMTACVGASFHLILTNPVILLVNIHSPEGILKYVYTFGIQSKHIVKRVSCSKLAYCTANCIARFGGSLQFNFG